MNTCTDFWHDAQVIRRIIRVIPCTTGFNYGAYKKEESVAMKYMAADSRYNSSCLLSMHYYAVREDYCCMAGISIHFT